MTRRGRRIVIRRNTRPKRRWHQRWEWSAQTSYAPDVVPIADGGAQRGFALTFGGAITKAQARSALHLHVEASEIVVIEEGEPIFPRRDDDERVPLEGLSS
jgi:hypothetical protein